MRPMPTRPLLTKVVPPTVTSASANETAVVASSAQRTAGSRREDRRKVFMAISLLNIRPHGPSAALGSDDESSMTTAAKGATARRSVSQFFPATFLSGEHPLHGEVSLVSINNDK